MTSTRNVRVVQVGIELGPGPAAAHSGRYTVERIDLHGGRLCLDFANTVVWRLAEQPDETLVSYQDFLTWSMRAKSLASGEVEALRRAAASRSDEAASILSRAVRLREAIHLVFLAAIAGWPTRPVDLAILNSELTEAMAMAPVRQTADGFTWGWATEPTDDKGETPLARPLWPIARSAADLLVGPDLSRVKRCHEARCGWLFLDTSRNGSRRWCDMAICGNRARVRAFAARKRAKDDAERE